MNIIFLTVSRIKEIKTRSIYTDLMRSFRDDGHNVYIISPVERQFGIQTELKEVDGVYILNVRTLNLQKTNLIEKGVGTILIERQYKNAIKTYLKNVTFDLILYSTPPITSNRVIEYIKRKNPKAKSYLMLKDIFPQNAVDLGMFSKKNPFYWYFRRKEERLYKNSDYIGCMSPANVEYLLKMNPSIIKEKVEICPNAIELEKSRPIIDKTVLRQKYNLPADKPVFIYGGNLGKPQGISYLIKCLQANAERRDCHFLIVGNGTEYTRLDTWYRKEKPANISLLTRLPKDEYDQLVQSCDVGLIFLDKRFTIPNYPSRLLSYLEYKMPIIAATDINCDTGSIAEANGYGYWCESVCHKSFTACVDKYVNNQDSIQLMGEKGYQFLLDNYLVKHAYNIIVKHCRK